MDQTPPQFETWMHDYNNNNNNNDKAMQQLKNPMPIQSPNSKRRLSLHQM